MFVTVNNVGIANNGQRDLGTISVGVNLTAFISISNSGTTALNLGNIQINGSGAGAFTSSAVSTQNVAPNTSANLSLTFNTTTAGNYTAFVTIANNVLGKNPYTFTVFATASVIPDIAVKQTANILANGAGNYVFANQNVNSASADVTFVIF
ncbi:MAG: choice-of-anchor D domain-containing protein [Bacteroidetes bacterium]|nr:MAG: choice-of-anchor D domain-containing protein [Bacteroidota bacterium]